MSEQPAVTLTIGGSDSGGAAGVQADLKTWTVLGVYGMSAITAVTAQNSIAVSAVQFMPPEIVGAQIDAVLSDYGAQAIKTGFLGQAEIIKEVSMKIRESGDAPLIVDPVLVNHKGEQMFSPDITSAYKRLLLPLAELVTPNWPEALLLSGRDLSEPPHDAVVSEVAVALAAHGPGHVLITGVPVTPHRVTDWWYDGRRLHVFEQPRIQTGNVHGSGDTLSAAICAYLARGLAMGEALLHARSYTARAIAGSAGWRLGKGHGPLRHFCT